MALIDCPQCSNQISDAAAQCPHCGYAQAPVAPQAQPKKGSGCGVVAIILGVVALVAVLIIGLLAAIAIPSFVSARNQARSGLCQNNLRLIEHAKEVVAIKDNLSMTSTPAASVVNNFITDGAPTCPEGGTYTYGPINRDPRCSHSSTDPDHTL